MTRWSMCLIVVLSAWGKLQAQSPLSDPQDLRERWNSYLQGTYSWKRIGLVTAETAFDQTFRFDRCGH